MATNQVKGKRKRPSADEEPTEDHLSGKDIEDRGNDSDEWEDYDEGQAVPKPRKTKRNQLPPKKRRSAKDLDDEEGGREYNDKLVSTVLKGDALRQALYDKEPIIPPNKDGTWKCWLCGMMGFIVERKCFVCKSPCERPRSSSKFEWPYGCAPAEGSG